MRVFSASDKDWEDFCLRKRSYLLTEDGEVREGYNRVITEGGAIADLNITDIAEISTRTGEIYILTAEIEKIWQ